MKSRFTKLLILSSLFLITGIFYQFKNQEKASAQVSPTAACGTSGSDVVLVIDRSGSMKETISGTNGTKMAKAKTAARRFVDILAKDSRNRVGVASFADQSSIDKTLTNNWDSAKTEIGSLTANGDTCTECGIYKGGLNIKQNSRSNIKKIIILLTDGKANMIQGNTNKVAVVTAENKAIAEAKNAHDTQGVIIFTIGVGDKVNSDFLKKIASVTGGKYYASPTSNDLNTIYDKISLIIAKGSVNGVVFYDINGNGAIESGESSLSGWNIELTAPGGITKNISSDANGNYSFSNLCDGSYTVKQNIQSGWQQTLPANNAAYTFNLTNGNSQSNKNFGNQQILPTKGPTCEEKPEDITVTPDNGTGIGEPGEEVVYTVKIKNNNNKNCDDATYFLSTSILNNTNNLWTYRFEQTNIELASGQSGSTKLRVTSPPNAQNGPKTITVIVQKSQYPQRTFNTTYNVVAKEITPTNTPTPMTPTNSPTVTPSLTPIPGRTFINLTLGIDGIGTTPRIPIGGNKNPDHYNRNLTLKLFNTSDNSKFGEYFEHTFTYNPSTEKFESQIELEGVGQTGNYNLYVQGPRYLYSQYPGSVSISQGQTLNLNSQNFYMITGNVNNVDLSENRIDLMDYNILLSCSIYSQDLSACNQDPKNSSYSDLDDNGIINEDDYTLFLKEFANQQGVILPD